MKISAKKKCMMCGLAGAAGSSMPGRSRHSLNYRLLHARLCVCVDHGTCKCTYIDCVSAVVASAKGACVDKGGCVEHQ